MKRQVYFQQLTILAIFLFFIISCNNIEKDWEKTIKSNSITGYNEFIKTHSDSIYIKQAKNAIDSLQWITDSISKDTSIMKKYFNKNLQSKYSERAKDLFSIYKWPSIQVKKANSVIIYHKGKTEEYGDVNKFINDGKIQYYAYHAKGDTVVEIYREILPKYLGQADSAGIRIGFAYTLLNKWYIIKKVDLNKNDSVLCSEFGVHGRNIKFVMYGGGGWYLNSGK